MAWCPFAVHKPIRENNTQGHITPRAIILHTAVSNAASLFDYFQNSTDLEAHFYVNQAGVIEQYLDTTVHADANLNANGFAVSIETWDSAAIIPWNSVQVEAIVRLVDWLCTTHGIPRVQIPRWDGAGIGWHVMFGAPGPWTPVSKSCPGAPRIDQTRNVIIPRVAAGQIEGDDMFDQPDRDAATAMQWRFYCAMRGMGEIPATTDVGNPPKSLVGQKIEQNLAIAATNTAIAALKADVAALKATATAPVPVAVDLDALADKVAARLGALRFDAEPGEQ